MQIEQLRTERHNGNVQGVTTHAHAHYNTYRDSHSKYYRAVGRSEGRLDVRFRTRPRCG